MTLLNQSDRESVQVKHINQSTIVNCRIPRIQSSNLPQSSTSCLIDVTIKGQPQPERAKYLEHIIAQQLGKCIEIQAYSGCSIRVVLFILNEGTKIFQGLLNCTIASLLLAGVAMRKTIYAVEEGQNLFVFNLATGNVVSSSIKTLFNLTQLQQRMAKYKEHLKGWLMSQMGL